MLSLRSSLSSALLLGSLVWVAGAFVACGGSAFTTEDEASGSGGGTSSGGSSSGGASAGGASAGGAGSGGASSGGSAAGGASTGGVTGTGATTATGGQGTGGAIVGACLIDSDCIAVVDKADVCGCQLPIAASKVDVLDNICLVPWEERAEPAPVGCAVDQDPDCLIVPCVPPPTCARARCNQGTCEVIGGNGSNECEDCDLLAQRRHDTLQAARACNPALSSISCDASAIVIDDCGCPFVVNERNPELVQAAQEASEAWLNSGCEPTLCPAVLCPTPTVGSCTSGGTCAGH
jgi:hypothetical protein